nr:hypothetical protein [Sphingomonas sp. ZFBP2030]
MLAWKRCANAAISSTAARLAAAAQQEVHLDIELFRPEHRAGVFETLDQPREAAGALHVVVERAILPIIADCHLAQARGVECRDLLVEDRRIGGHVAANAEIVRDPDHVDDVGVEQRLSAVKAHRRHLCGGGVFQQQADGF